MEENVFRAEYIPNEISKDKEDVISKMMPVFRELSQVFGVNIIIDCHNGPFPIQEFQVYNPNSVTIGFHIDSFPARFHSISTISASSIFGLIPTKAISLDVIVPSRNTPQYGLPKTNLFSPESFPIGCILGTHIFIYPRVLTSDAWNNGNNFSLLRAISFWFLPKAISNSPDNRGAGIRDGLNIIRSEYRNFYLHGFSRREAFRNNFGLFVRNFNSKILNRLEEKIGEIEQKLEKLSKNYFESLGAIVQNMDRLEMIRNDVSARDFGKEFEFLLIMEPIETVRIKDGRYMIIKTGPILQLPNADLSYDIGEFTIEIDTGPPDLFLLSRSAIKFYQNGYTGPFKHAHINQDTAICFGNAIQADNIGLNPIIDRLMVRFDTVPLIHLIITFMKKERTAPNARDKWDNAVTPQPDSYATVEDRESEKNNFIKLVSEAVLRSSMGLLKKEISESNKKIDALRSEIILEKMMLDDYLAMFNKLNDLLANTNDLNKEVECLLDDESIFGLFISDEEIVIYFYCQRIDLLETRYLPENFILRIAVESPPRLLTLSPKKALQNIQLIDPGRFEANKPDSEDEVIIKNLQIGHISEILKVTKEKIVNGIFDYKSKNQDKKETNHGQ